MFFKCPWVYLFPLMGILSYIDGVDSTQHIFFPDEGDGVPPVDDTPAEGDEEELDPSKANSLSSLEDFANYFQFSLPPEKKITLISPRFGGPRDGAGLITESLPQATCIPEMTPVPLDLPRGSGFSYFPTCVRVNRCGGCCLLSHHSCQPTSVEMINVKAVKVLDEVMKPRRRRVRRVEPEYITVEVERHLACDCGCKLQASDCNSAIHVYNENLCECKCKDSAKEETCRASRDHFWDSDTCQCLCRRVLTCSSGREFNHKDCSCR